MAGKRLGVKAPRSFCILGGLGREREREKEEGRAKETREKLLG